MLILKLCPQASNTFTTSRSYQILSGDVVLANSGNTALSINYRKNRIRINKNSTDF